MRADIADTPIGRLDSGRAEAPPRRLLSGLSGIAWRRFKPGALTIGTAMLWLVAYVNLMSYSLTMAPETPTLALAIRRAIFCACCAGLCGLVYAVLDRTRKMAAGWRYAIAGLLILIACGAYHYLFGILFFVLWPIFHEPFSWTMQSVLTIFTGAIWYFLSSVILYFAVSYGADARDKERRLGEAQRLALDSQNRMLRYQINPHFLFNSLNALSSLVVYKESERADEMLQSLSSFLRYSLDKNPDDKVALREELDAQRQYLRIEQIRFGERLKFIEAVPEELMDAMVPSLILQPLIENALKHGFRVMPDGAVIEVAAARTDKGLRITICDNGAPAVPGEMKPGVGLRNVRRRIEVIYGTAGRFEYHRREPRGFEVILTLPLETK
jgi:two-component system LytT family sensor kinase